MRSATVDTAGRTEPATDAAAVLEVKALEVEFVYRTHSVPAVRNVSFAIAPGQTLALVGESGSGKSLTALAIMQLLPSAGRVTGGEVLYRRRTGEPVDIVRQSRQSMQGIRGSEIAMIFQEPMTSLNPLYTVGDQIAEMLLLHDRVDARGRRTRAREMLDLVEIPDAERRLDDYPHQLSGGMRQRIMIAMALACDPVLLIADEPTTALDVTVQAQILDLLNRLRHELGMSVLFITHSLGVVAEIADTVAVMYAGAVVERAPAMELFGRPGHPYTRGLLAAMPRPAGRGARLTPIDGTVPSIHAMPPGCAFAPRCPLAESKCTGPTVWEAIGPQHYSACWKEGRGA